MSEKSIMIRGKDISTYSPSDLLVIKIENLERELAAAKSRIEELEGALREYANEENWWCSQHEDSCSEHNQAEWIGRNGYEIAKQVLGGKGK